MEVQTHESILLATNQTESAYSNVSEETNISSLSVAQYQQLIHMLSNQLSSSSSNSSAEVIQAGSSGSNCAGNSYLILLPLGSLILELHATFVVVSLYLLLLNLFPMLKPLFLMVLQCLFLELELLIF